MFKKIVSIGLVGLFLVVSFVVAEDSIGPYNPAADVNRDGTVDILDLVEVGQAYGSTYAPIIQLNKTTVTVLSYESSNLSFVENALVAVFAATGMKGGHMGTINVQTTNSSGTVSFELNPNTDYIAMVWDEHACYDTNTAYNYASFTTNATGEASVTIWLKPHPTSPPIRTSPQGWVIMTFYNDTSRELLVYDELADGLDVIIQEFTAMPWNTTHYLEWRGDSIPLACYVCEGILALAPDWAYGGNKPRTSYAVSFRPGDYQQWPAFGNFTYRTDDSGGAYAVGFYYG